MVLWADMFGDETYVGCLVLLVPPLISRCLLTLTLLPHVMGSLFSEVAGCFEICKVKAARGPVAEVNRCQRNLREVAGEDDDLSVR